MPSAGKTKHGGSRKGAGKKAEDAEGKLSQYRLSLDKPTVAIANQVGRGNISRGVRIAVKAYPVKERK